MKVPCKLVADGNFSVFFFFVFFCFNVRENKGSKFVPFIEGHFSEGRQSNFGKVASLKLHQFP